jgi:hypothetical protein
MALSVAGQRATTQATPAAGSNNPIVCIKNLGRRACTPLSRVSTKTPGPGTTNKFTVCNVGGQILAKPDGTNYTTYERLFAQLSDTTNIPIAFIKLVVGNETINQANFARLITEGATVTLIDDAPMAVLHANDSLHVTIPHIANSMLDKRISITLEKEHVKIGCCDGFFWAGHDKVVEAIETAYMDSTPLFSVKYDRQENQLILRGDTATTRPTWGYSVL